MMDQKCRHLTLTNPDFFPVVTKILHQGASVRFRVTGRSMAPFLAGGEIVTVRQCRSKDLVPGDLILFNDGMKVMVHRLIKKKKINGQWSFVPKGDSVSNYDIVIHDENILGKVCLIEKSTDSSRRIINMESRIWKRINPLFATLSRLRSYLTGIFWLPFKLRLTERACQLCWCCFSK